MNLFAWRSTDPKGLRKTPDPVGPDNDTEILGAAGQADVVMAAWGTHGGYLGRDLAVWSLLAQQEVTMACLGLTKAGHPKHPLMPAYSSTPQPLPAMG